MTLTTPHLRRYLAALVLASTFTLLAGCGAAAGPRKLPCTGDACVTDNEPTAQAFCVRDLDCADGERCVGGACSTEVPEPANTCATTQDCAAGLYCDTDAGRCVECLRDLHCDQGLACRADFTCGPSTGCATDGECADGRCNLASGECVSCITASDCAPAEVCASGECIASPEPPAECTTQTDCDARGLICDTTGTCVACSASAQCGNGKQCSLGTCVPDDGNVRTPGVGDLVVNEILADPPSDTIGTSPVEGDANGDGVRDTFNDELVELVNPTGTTLDVTNCTLTVKTTLRHRFEPSTDPLRNLVPPHAAIVVFGGGAPTGGFGGARTFVASSGSLTLANDGGSVTLDCPTLTGPQTIDSVSYLNGCNDQSFTRAVDGDRNAAIVHHLTVADAPYSPGTCADGRSFASCL